MENIFDILKSKDTLGPSGHIPDSRKGVSGTVSGSEYSGNAFAVSDASSVDGKDGAKSPGNCTSEEDEKRSKMDYIIPKLKRKDSALLRLADSHEINKEIKPAIRKSILSPQTQDRYTYTRFQIVQNAELINAYLEKRKEMKKAGYSDRDLADTYAFLLVESEQEKLTICRGGLKRGNLDISCLGHPEMAVQLCRHADMLRPVPFPTHYTGQFIVFKIMKGRVKYVMEQSNNQLEPTPNYDCHLVRSSPSDLPCSNIHSSFESQQFYLYEYGETASVEDRPRHVCPLAVVDFTYTYGGEIPHSRTPESPILSPRLSPAPPRPTPPSAKEKVDEEFVIWCGRINVNGGSATCRVQMLSTAGTTKPCRLGTTLKLRTKYKMSMVKEKFFGELASLRKNGEVYWKNNYINICEMRPEPRSRTLFEKLHAYLGRSESAAAVKIDKDTYLLLLPPCQLTHQLGLFKPFDFDLVLHCIFISKKSCYFNSPRYQFKQSTGQLQTPSVQMGGSCLSPLHINISNNGPLSPSVFTPPPSTPTDHIWNMGNQNSAPLFPPIPLGLPVSPPPVSSLTLGLLPPPPPPQSFASTTQNPKPYPGSSPSLLRPLGRQRSPSGSQPSLAMEHMPASPGSPGRPLMLSSSGLPQRGSPSPFRSASLSVPSDRLSYGRSASTEEPFMEGDRSTHGIPHRPRALSSPNPLHHPDAGRSSQPSSVHMLYDPSRSSLPSNSHLGFDIPRSQPSHLHIAYEDGFQTGGHTGTLSVDTIRKSFASQLRLMQERTAAECEQDATISSTFTEDVVETPASQPLTPQSSQLYSPVAPMLSHAPRTMSRLRSCSHSPGTESPSWSVDSGGGQPDGEVSAKRPRMTSQDGVPPVVVDGTKGSSIRHDRASMRNFLDSTINRDEAHMLKMGAKVHLAAASGAAPRPDSSTDATRSPAQGPSAPTKSGIVTANEMKNFLNANLTDPNKPPAKPPAKPPGKPRTDVPGAKPPPSKSVLKESKAVNSKMHKSSQDKVLGARHHHHHRHHHLSHHHSQSESSERRRKIRLHKPEWKKINRRFYILNGRVPVVAVERLDVTDILHKSTVYIPSISRKLGLEGLAAAKRKLFVSSDPGPSSRVCAAPPQAKPRSGRPDAGDSMPCNLFDRLCGPTLLPEASHDHEGLPILKLKRSQGQKWQRVQAVSSKDTATDLNHSVQHPSAVTSPCLKDVDIPDRPAIKNNKSRLCHVLHSHSTQKSPKPVSHDDHSDLLAGKKGRACSESLPEDPATTSHVLLEVLSPSMNMAITTQSNLKHHLSTEECIGEKHSKQKDKASKKESGKLRKATHSQKHCHSHHSKTKVNDPTSKSGSKSSKSSHRSKVRETHFSRSTKDHKKSKRTHPSGKTHSKKEEIAQTVEPAPRTESQKEGSASLDRVDCVGPHGNHTKDIQDGSAIVMSEDSQAVDLDSSCHKEHLKTTMTECKLAKCDPAISGAELPISSKGKKHHEDKSCERDSCSLTSKSADHKKDVKSKIAERKMKDLGTDVMSKKTEKKMKDSGKHSYNSKDCRPSKVKSSRKEGSDCKSRSSSDVKKLKTSHSDHRSSKAKSKMKKDARVHTKDAACSEIEARPRETRACEGKDDTLVDVCDAVDLHSHADEREVWSPCGEGQSSPSKSDPNPGTAYSCKSPETESDSKRKEDATQPGGKDADQAELSGQSQKGFPSSFKRKMPSGVTTASCMQHGPSFARRSVVDLPWQFTNSTSSYRDSYGIQNYPSQALSSTFLKPDSCSAFRSSVGMDLTAARRPSPSLRPQSLLGLPGRSSSETLAGLNSPELMPTPQATQMQLPLSGGIAQGMQNKSLQQNQLLKLTASLLQWPRQSLFSQTPSNEALFRRGVAAQGNMGTPPCLSTLNHRYPLQARTASLGRAERPAPGSYLPNQRFPAQHSPCLKRTPDVEMGPPVQDTVGMQSAERKESDQFEVPDINSELPTVVAVSLNRKPSPAASAEIIDGYENDEPVPVSAEGNDGFLLSSDSISSVASADFGKEETATESAVETLLTQESLPSESYDFSTDEDAKTTSISGTETSQSEAAKTAQQSKMWEDPETTSDTEAVSALSASEDLKESSPLKEDVGNIPLPSPTNALEMEVPKTYAVPDISLSVSLPSVVDPPGEALPGDKCSIAADQTSQPSDGVSGPNTPSTKPASIDEEEEPFNNRPNATGVIMSPSNQDAEGGKHPLPVSDSEDRELCNSTSTHSDRRVVVVTAKIAEAVDSPDDQEKLSSEGSGSAQRSDGDSNESSHSPNRRRQPFRFGMASKFLREEERELSGRAERSRDVVEDRHRRQYHPYQRTCSSRKSFATFDLLYTKKELFGDLTASSFKQKRLKGELSTPNEDRTEGRFNSLRSRKFCRKIGQDKLEEKEEKEANKDNSIKAVLDELQELEAEAAEEEEEAATSLQERIQMADMLDKFYEEQRHQEADDAIFDQQKQLYQSSQHSQESFDYEPMDIDEEEEDGTNLIEYVHEADKWNPRMDSKAAEDGSQCKSLSNSQEQPSWQPGLPSLSLSLQPEGLAFSSATASLQPACDKSLLLSLLQGAPPPPPPPSPPPLPSAATSQSSPNPTPCLLPASSRSGPEAVSHGGCGGPEEPIVASEDKSKGHKEHLIDKLGELPVPDDLPGAGGELTYGHTDSSGMASSPAQALSGGQGQTVAETGQSGIPSDNLGLKKAQSEKQREPKLSEKMILSDHVTPTVSESIVKRKQPSSGVSMADIKRVLARYGVPEGVCDLDEISQQLSTPSCTKPSSRPLSTVANPMQPSGLADPHGLHLSNVDHTCSSSCREPSRQEGQAVLLDLRNGADLLTVQIDREAELKSRDGLLESVTEEDMRTKVTGGLQTPKKDGDSMEANPGSPQKPGAGDEGAWVETPEKGCKAKFRKCRYSWDAAKMFVNKVIKPWPFKVYPVTLDCRPREYRPNPDLFGMDVVKMNGAGMKDPRLVPRSRKPSSKSRSDRARPGAHPRGRLGSHSSLKEKLSSRLSHPGSELSSKSGSLREQDADGTQEPSFVAGTVAQSALSVASDGATVNDSNTEAQELISSSEKLAYSCHQSSSQQDPRIGNPFYNQTLGLDGKPSRRDGRVRSENSTAPHSLEDLSSDLLGLSTNHEQQRRNKTSQRLDEVLMSIMSREDHNQPPASTEQERNHTAVEVSSVSGHDGLLQKVSCSASSQPACLPMLQKRDKTLHSMRDSYPPVGVFLREKSNLKMASTLPSISTTAGDPLAEMKQLQGKERPILPQGRGNCGTFESVSRPEDGYKGNAVDSYSFSKDVASKPIESIASKKAAVEEYFTTSITSDDYYCQVDRKASWAAGSSTRNYASLGLEQPVSREDAMLKLSLPFSSNASSKSQHHPSLSSCKGSSLFGACHAQTVQAKEDMSVLDIMGGYGAGKAGVAEQTSAAKNPFEQLLEMPAAKLLIKNFKHTTSVSDAPCPTTTPLKKMPRQDPRLARQRSLLSEPPHLTQ